MVGCVVAQVPCGGSGEGGGTEAVAAMVAGGYVNEVVFGSLFVHRKPSQKKTPNDESKQKIVVLPEEVKILLINFKGTFSTVPAHRKPWRLPVATCSTAGSSCWWQAAAPTLAGQAKPLASPPSSR